MFENDPIKVRIHRLLADHIRQSDRLVLYKAFKRFRNEEPLPAEGIFKVDGIYQFRNTPIQLQENDARRLAELCCDPKSFDLWFGMKMCLFDEDYCLEWHHGSTKAHYLFCFSCGDAYGASTESQVLSLHNPKVFKEILTRY